MSQKNLHAIKQEVKEKCLAKQRKAWFDDYRRVKNVTKVCKYFGISRSQFYYWKNRLDLESSAGKGMASRAQRLMAYSRKPHSHPSQYSEELVKLIVKIRKRTNRGAEHLWFILKDKYAIDVSVSGIYKVLKREGLITERRRTYKKSATYKAPTYLPGDKVQIDVKYVKLVDEVAKKRGKTYRFVFQYTALDVATGIKCKLIYEDHTQNASMDFLSRVRLFYPFPLKVIQTDNGREFTFHLLQHVKKVHPFTQQCTLFGYEHHLIPPAYPRANSHVERTHRTDEEEVYRGKIFTSLQELHTVNLKTVKYFNEKRPQKAKHFFSPTKYATLKFRLHTCHLNYTVLNVRN